MATPVNSSGEIVVSQTDVSTTPAPAIAALDDGGYIVVWAGYDGDNDGVTARFYNADGSARGNEIQINTYTSGVQGDPDVAVLDDGSIIVVWQSEGQDGDGYDERNIYGQRLSSAGTTVGSEFLVNTTTGCNQETPSVSALDGGGFVVTWSGGNENDGINYLDVHAQRFNNSGVAVGGEIAVTGALADYQYADSVTALPGGGFVVTWTTDVTVSGG